LSDNLSAFHLGGVRELLSGEYATVGDIC
jgi:hypothetical protein